MNNSEQINALYLPFAIASAQIEENEEIKNVIGSVEDALIEPDIERGVIFIEMNETRDKGGSIRRRRPENLVTMGKVF